MRKILFTLLACSFFFGNFGYGLESASAENNQDKETKGSVNTNTGTGGVDNPINNGGPASDKAIELLEDMPGGQKIRTGNGAIGIFEQYVRQAYLFGTGLVSLVAVLWIIMGGYEIMIKGSGSGADISSGKEKITKALMGIVLVFLSALILNTINPGFFEF